MDRTPEQTRRLRQALASLLPSQEPSSLMPEEPIEPSEEE